MLLASDGLVRRYLPMQYLLPVLLLLVTSFGCMLALLFHITAMQDQIQRSREIQFARGAFDNAANLVLRDLQDYAKWDEAVLHLTQHFDADWADDNVSAYLGVVQGYDHVYVLDGQDRPIYAFSAGKRLAAAPDVARGLGHAFTAGLRKVRQMDPTGAPILSGFSRAGDRLFIYSVAQVVPLTGKIASPPGPPHLLVIAMEMDQAWLNNLPAAVRHGRQITFTRPDSSDGGDTAIVLPGHDGRMVARVAWTAVKPGIALRRQLVPGSILIALIALLAAGAILSRARNGLNALRASEARALHHAHHDNLTGLPNRRVILGTLAEAIARGDATVLIYMDLDGFKEANDVYGHPVGDEVLRQAAQRIADAASDAALVARTGGDEFAIVMIAPTDEAVKSIVGRVMSAFSTPFETGGYNITVGISIGSAAGGNELEPDELVRRADVAMYSAKGGGKHRWCAYEPSMDVEHLRRRQLESDLRRAIRGGEIGVAFQPIVDARSNAIVSVEALARWSHPEFGEVAPDVFIEVAEKSGLINDLGRHVLAVACRVVRDWDVDLAVNLSPAQFWDHEVGEIVREVLAETGFSPLRLELEITEGYLLRRPEAAQFILEELKALGVRIALDDFGTGFASIGYLQRLSFDRIKIDRSFITASVKDARAAEMVRAIIVLANALNLPVTAEGIETSEQAALARLAGCSRLQGWLFGRPLTAEQMAELLNVSLQSARLQRTVAADGRA